MAITNVATATGNTQNTATTKTTSTTGFGDNFDTFLRLLTTQLKNQDPLSPLDTNQFTQQLVSFSQVEQAIKQNDKLSQIISQNSSNQLLTSQSLVGKNVEFDGSTTKLADGKALFAYSLPTDAVKTSLAVTNQAGKVVYAGTGETTSGSHDFAWNGRDSNGATVTDGLYTLSVTSVNGAGSTLATTVHGVAKVDSIEAGGTATNPTTNMVVGGLRIPTTKMLAIRDKI